jgi:hypothetical protein
MNQKIRLNRAVDWAFTAAFIAIALFGRVLFPHALPAYRDGLGILAYAALFFLVVLPCKDKKGFGLFLFILWGLLLFVTIVSFVQAVLV